MHRAQKYHYDDMMTCKLCAAKEFKDTAWIVDGVSISYNLKRCTITEENVFPVSDIDGELRGRSECALFSCSGPILSCDFAYAVLCKNGS